jgi:hypothetical protein
MEQDLQTQINELKRQVEFLTSLYNKDNNPSSEIFTKDAYFRRNVSIGESSSKVSVYGEPPVVQASTIATLGTPSGIYVFSEQNDQTNAINSIITAIKNFGIIA